MPSSKVVVGGVGVRYAVREEREDVVECFEDRTQPTRDWLRTKRAEVDLKHQTPFALERQLEDQRFQIEKNRNPRGQETTRMEKPRSEVMIQTSNASDPLITKIKVVNKIVRDATGVYNYTLVPPPRKHRNKVPEKLDPDTHPLTKPYREAAKQVSSGTSFGHRPSSASRTFVPGTMSIRLKSEEMLKAVKSGSFGLNPATLSKLLVAPMYVNPLALPDDESPLPGHTAATASGPASHNAEALAKELFFNEEESRLMKMPTRAVHHQQNQKRSSSSSSDQGAEATGSPKKQIEFEESYINEYVLDTSSQSSASRVDGGGSISFAHTAPSSSSAFLGGAGRSGGLGGGTGTSSAAGSVSPGSKARSLGNSSSLKKKKKVKPYAESVPIDRPHWNDWHHHIDHSEDQLNMYKLRASGLDRDELTPKDRITRFAAKTTTDPDDPKLYCKEKHELDRALLVGEILHSKLGGREAKSHLYDPDQEAEFIKVKRLRRRMDKEIEKRENERSFVRELRGVPQVTYHPEALKQRLNEVLPPSGAEDPHPSQTTAAVVTATKEMVQSLTIQTRGPYLDTSKPPSPTYKSPRARANDEVTITQAPMQPNAMANYVRQKVVPTGSKVLKVTHKSQSPKRLDPLKSSQGKLKVSDLDAKSEVALEEWKMVDTAPHVPREMRRAEKELMATQSRPIATVKPVPMQHLPAIYGGPDWSEHLHDSLRVVQPASSVPSASDYIASLKSQESYNVDSLIRQFSNANTSEEKEAHDDSKETV